MALISKREFAASMGMDYDLQSVRSGFSMNIKRGKIIETDGDIDDSHPMNVTYFLKHKKDGVEQKVEVKPKKIVNKEVKVEKKKVVEKNQWHEPPETKQKRGQDKSTTDLYDLEIQVKRAKIEKDIAEKRMMDLREQKLRGEVVPVELVTHLFAAMCKSVFAVQKNTSEKIIANIARRYKFTEDQLAEIRGDLILELNSGAQSTIDATKEELQPIVKSFSEKRGVGQKD